MNPMCLIGCLLLAVVGYVQAGSSGPHSGGIGGLVSMGDAPVDCDPEVGSKFSQIEDHLQRHVDSDDPEANMAEAERWFATLDGRMKPFKDKKTIKALEIFTDISTISKKSHKCEDVRTILRIVDECLMQDETRAKGGNYPFKRVEKVIDHFAWKLVEHCRFAYINFVQLAVKRQSYREIDEYLKAETTDKEDTEGNMAKVDELLEKTLAESGEGALTEAIRQIQKLKTIQEDTECGQESVDIMHKNLRLLGQHYSQIFVPETPLGHLAFHYASNFVTECKKLLPGKFKEVIKSLSAGILHNLRVILNEFGMKRIESEEVDAQFQKEFTTPGFYEAYKDGSIDFFIYKAEEAFKALLVLAANDPDAKYLKMQTDEETGKQYIDFDKVRELFNKYLLEPCTVFEKTTSKFFDLYYTLDHVSHSTQMSDDIDTYLPVLLGNTATHSCSDVRFYSTKDYIERGMATPVRENSH